MKKKPNNKPDKNILDAMSNNPLNWKGPFYYNKNDSRILVPKQNKSFGWTLNFANPNTYFLLAFSVIAVALLQYIFNFVYALK